MKFLNYLVCSAFAVVAVFAFGEYWVGNKGNRTTESSLHSNVKRDPNDYYGTNSPKWGTKMSYPVKAVYGSVVHSTDRFAVRAASQIDKQHPYRFVELDLSLAPEHVTEEARLITSRSEKSEYAVSKVSEYLERECERVREIFAEKCWVDETEVSLRRNGHVRIKSKLLFVQSDPFGELDADREYRYSNSQVKLYGWSVNKYPRFATLEERINYIYTSAKKHCRSIKRKSNTCAIHSITVRKHTDRNGKLGGGTAGAFLVNLKRI